MSTISINARVDAETKKAADRVLAAQRRTWSQAIQALAAYIGRTHTFPAVLDEPSPDEMAERQRKLDILMGVCGISSSPELATDEGTDQVLYEALLERYGY